MTPNIAIVHVDYPHWRRFPAVAPVIPAVGSRDRSGAVRIVVLLIACLALGVRFGRSIAALWNLLCSLPGTDVRVCTEGNRVLVRIL